MMRIRFVIAGLALPVLLAGCGRATLQTVKVPLPVECRVQMPARPAMPTESLRAGVTLDRFAASALAEIELREGYEHELRTALLGCTAPIAPS
jgi:hypothetical protein